MTQRGAGDRWLAGVPVAGVRFAMGDTVRVAGGPLGGQMGGQRGRVAMLIGLAPEPVYLVTLSDGRDVRARQSELVREG